MLHYNEEFNIMKITQERNSIVGEVALLISYAPINVNPEGGGGRGRAKGGDLINQVVPWVGIWTDTFFLSGPRVGIFDRLTLISDDILKKPEPILEQTLTRPQSPAL